MYPFLALVLAIIATAGWLFAVSYVDYLVAGYRRSEVREPGSAPQPLALERVLGLPWAWPSWLTSGLVVFGLALVAALLQFGLFLLLSFVGAVVLATVVLSDWQQLQQGSRARTSTPVAGLHGIRGEHVGSHFPLQAAELTIGRANWNHLRLREKQVSRKHARVCYAQGRFYLQDLDSLHGTRLNGRPITSSVLQDGDQITICSSTFEFRIL